MHCCCQSSAVCGLPIGLRSNRSGFPDRHRPAPVNDRTPASAALHGAFSLAPRFSRLGNFRGIPAAVFNHAMCGGMDGSLRSICKCSKFARATQTQSVTPNEKGFCSQLDGRRRGAGQLPPGVQQDFFHMLWCTCDGRSPVMVYSSR